GGRYTPAVGWALGIERVVELMRLNAAAAAAQGTAPAGLGPQGPDVFTVSVGEPARREGFKAAEQLRERVQGLRISIGAPSAGFKAQLRRADKSGARYAVIIGEDELSSGVLSVKPLRTDEAQQSLSLDELVLRLSSA